MAIDNSDPVEVVLVFDRVKRLPVVREDEETEIPVPVVSELAVTPRTV